MSRTSISRKDHTPENAHPHEDIKMGSDRAFGLVFAVLFAIIAFFPVIKDEPVRLWALGICAVFLLVALIRPALLQPLNKIWFQFGLGLHKIMSPVIMAVLFIIAIVPVALIFKIIGKDPLFRKFDKTAETYWITRDPPGPDPEHMKQQF